MSDMYRGGNGLILPAHELVPMKGMMGSECDEENNPGAMAVNGIKGVRKHHTTPFCPWEIPVLLPQLRQASHVQHRDVPKGNCYSGDPIHHSAINSACNTSDSCLVFHVTALHS